MRTNTTSQIWSRQAFAVGWSPAVLVMTICSWASIGSAQTPPPDFFAAQVNGDVLAVQVDGRILVGGYNNQLARLNPDGTLDTGFNPEAEGDVRSVALQPDGKILAGGYFMRLAGQERSYLARLNPNGTLDSGFNFRPNGPVLAMAIQADGKILVGGFGITSGGQHLARLYPDGTLDTGFNSPANSVGVLAIQADGKILVGDSGMYNQPSGSYLARLNADGTLDAGFNPGGDASVLSLAVQADGKILVGGHFRMLGGQPRPGIGRLNADGTLDSAFSPTASAYCNYGPISPSFNSLAVQTDGKVLVGGGFTMLGALRDWFGRLNQDGRLDSQFISQEPWWRVNSLALQDDGRILICRIQSALGRLNNTEPATHSLSYDGATITWLRGGTSPEVWRASFESSIDGLSWAPLGEGARVPGGWELNGISAPPGGRIRARGWVSSGGVSDWFVEAYYATPPFISFHPVSRTNDAGTTAVFTAVGQGSEPLSYRWLKDGLPLADGGNINRSLTAILSVSNVLRADEGGYTIVISNSFGSVTSLVATLTVSEPVITSQPWHPFGNAGETVVFSVTAAGTTLSYQWLKDGVALSSATGDSLTLTNLKPQDAGNYQVVASNQFGSITSTVYPLTVNFVTLDTGFNPGGQPSVYYSKVSSLVLQPDGMIVVGGRFTTLFGQTRNLARLNTDGALDSGFNSSATFPESAVVYCGNDIASINSLALQPDARILVGGLYTTLDAQPRTNIARVNASGALDVGFNPGGVMRGGWSEVHSVAVQPDGKVLVGGEFSSLGGQLRTNLARFNTDGTLEQGFNPGTKRGNFWSVVNSVAVQPDGKILVGGHFTTLGGRSRTNLGRLNGDGTLDLDFTAEANESVTSLSLQPDGKILVTGFFTTLSGQPRTNLARLNADGTLDSAFNTQADNTVNALAIQADGKILVGGYFTSLGGQRRNGLGRLNADGTVESDFCPWTDAFFGPVSSLAIQADGKILVAGGFTSLCGQPRAGIGRLNNTEPATQSLSFDGSAITWLRGGSSPEVWRTTLETSADGVTWNYLGPGERITGGWQLAAISVARSATIRARGFIAAGGKGEGIVETILPGLLQTSVAILTNDGAFGVTSNRFGFNIAGVSGQVVVVESSTNLLQWFPLQTNTLGSNLLYFSDPNWGQSSSRFYRVRLR